MDHPKPKLRLPINKVDIVLHSFNVESQITSHPELQFNGCTSNPFVTN